MRSKQRSERLKLLVDPDERDISNVRDTASRPGFDIVAARRSDGAGPKTDLGDDGSEPPRRRALPMAMALITLVGFAGVIWYAYDWGLGQVETGRLPVILAESQPIKSRPESPGGLDVPHQDKLVLNEVVPDPEKPQVERLLPPPETPRPPIAPSAVEVEIAVPPIETAAGPPDGSTRSAVPPPPPPVPERVAGDTPPEPALAPPQIAAQPVTPELATPELATPELAAPKPAAPKPAAPKPATPKLAAPETAAAKLAVQTAARTPSGAYVVQVAALKVRDGARSAWARLQRAHPGLLGDKQLTVKKVDLGARGIFYRVRVGFFADRAGASALCRALKARQQDCLVAKR